MLLFWNGLPGDPGDDLLYFNIPLSNGRIWVKSGKGQHKKGWRLVPEVKVFLYGCGVYDREGWMFHMDPSLWDQFNEEQPQAGQFLAITGSKAIHSRGRALKGLGYFTPGLLMNRADKPKAAMFKLAWL